MGEKAKQPLFEAKYGPEIVRATPELIKEFKDMTPCPNDRNVRPRDLENLRRQFREDKLRAPEWASALCEETSLEYRVNGKHTSIVLDEELPEGAEFYVILTRFYCKTLQNVADLYATFDSSISSRKVGDIYRAYAGSDPELMTKVPHDLLQYLPIGIAFARWGEKAKVQPADAKAKHFLENRDFALWAVDVLRGARGDADYLLRGPVIAAIKRTYEKDKVAASNFWKAVRSGNGANPLHGDRVLQKYLLSTVLLGSGIGKVSRRVDSPTAMYHKCISAWNSWRQGREIRLLQYRDGSDLEVL
jgi:hypothetical protein